jgi:hypothetical protein
MLVGMGTLYKADSQGNVIDCDLFSNFFQTPCWNPFASEVVPVAPSGGGGAAVPAVPAPPDPNAVPSWLWMAGVALAGLVIVPPLLRGGR